MPTARQHAPSADRDVQAISYEEAPLFRPPPLATYEEIVARPLFSESRRPPPAEEQTVEAFRQPSTGQYVLTGLLVSGDNRFALVSRRGGGESWQLTLGQEFEGWRVTAITERSVQLELGEFRDEILFADDEETRDGEPIPQQATSSRSDGQVGGTRVRSGGRARR